MLKKTLKRLKKEIGKILLPFKEEKLLPVSTLETDEIRKARLKRRQQKYIELKSDPIKWAKFIRKQVLASKRYLSNLKSDPIKWAKYRERSRMYSRGYYYRKRGKPNCGERIAKKEGK